MHLNSRIGWWYCIIVLVLFVGQKLKDVVVDYHFREVDCFSAEGTLAGAL